VIERTEIMANDNTQVIKDVQWSQESQGQSWAWSYGSWIYNYLCIRCLSPLMLWVRIPLRVRCTTLCDKVTQWLATGRWFSPGNPISSTNKTDRHDITEILLKVALNTIKPNPITGITRLFFAYSHMFLYIVLSIILMEEVWNTSL
jgi:hypothetical protein